MSKIKIISITLLALLLNSCGFLGTCDDEPIDQPFTDPYKAVVLERTEFENSIQVQPEQPIIKSGKIYIKDDLMFINDVNKGFHVYSYENPETPVKLGFIKIVGATDLAVRNQSIYINQATDLVTLSYNPTNNSIAVLHRNRSVFPQKISPNGSSQYVTPNQVIVDWTLN